MKYVKVKGHDNLVRNSDSNFIVNTNQSGYQEYLSHKNKAESMEEDLATLKNEISEIKSLLRELVNGN